MDHAGYHWTIVAGLDGWNWRLLGRDDAQVVLEGREPSRALAAASVVRAIALGLTTEAAVAQSLAA